MSLSQPTGVQAGAGVTGGQGKEGARHLAVLPEDATPPALLAGIQRHSPEAEQGVQGRQRRAVAGSGL